MAAGYEAGFDHILIHLLHCLIWLKNLFLKYNASLISWLNNSVLWSETLLVNLMANFWWSTWCLVFTIVFHCCLCHVGPQLKKHSALAPAGFVIPNPAKFGPGRIWIKSYPVQHQNALYLEPRERVWCCKCHPIPVSSKSRNLSKCDYFCHIVWYHVVTYWIQRDYFYVLYRPVLYTQKTPR